MFQATSETIVNITLYVEATICSTLVGKWYLLIVGAYLFLYLYYLEYEIARID
jgi:hypothetical protein